MEVDEILEKAKIRIDARKSELEQLKHKQKAYVVEQVKAKYPDAIFENGELSEQTPQDTYSAASCALFRVEHPNCGPPSDISSDLVFMEMTDQIRKITCEIHNGESDLHTAGKFTDAVNILQDKLLLKEELINDLQVLKSKIDLIDSRIDSARTEFCSCKEKLGNLKEFIG